MIRWLRIKSLRLYQKVRKGINLAGKFYRTPISEIPGRIIFRFILSIQKRQRQAIRAIVVLFLILKRIRIAFIAICPKVVQNRKKPSILFLTEGDSRKGQAPASRFRVSQYLPYLRKAGIRYKVCRSKPGKYFHVTARFNRMAKKYPRFTQLWYLAGNIWMTYNRMSESFLEGPRYDACFLQRELVPNSNMFVEMFVLSCFNKVIFDFDDSIFMLPSWASAEKGGRENTEMETKINYLISRSSQVIVSNEFLRGRVASLNPHVCVLPTPVDTTYYRPVERGRNGNSPISIGWVGTSGNLFYLKQIMGVFERLWEEKFNFKLLIICNVPDQDYGVDMSRDYIEFRKWKLRDEVKNFDAIDIGIMPLTDDDWTRGKAGFKILQYMASGIPVIASPVGVNSDIVRHGKNGFLAQTEEEWVGALKELIENKKLREIMGRQGRIHAENYYSLKVIAPEFITIIEKQLKSSC
jgi:glycosyltransferase involved in cell wall biosynthesis